LVGLDTGGNVAELVALVTSVGMEDYLMYTMPKNIGLFDRFYVLISEKDQVSERLCADLGATPVRFDGFFSERSVFNKSGGLRAAQEMIHGVHPDAWVSIMDVDILVDEKLSELDLEYLNKNSMYGMSRFDAHTYEDYRLGRLRRHPGTARGKIIGYFQMYFDKSKYYAKKSRNACGCDVAFASLFDENVFLGDMRAIHIGKAASHWNGRGGERLNWAD
jgi:hypothetical protein